MDSLGGRGSLDCALGHGSGRGQGGGDAGEDADDGFLDGGVGLKVGGYVDKCDVQRKVTGDKVTVETICFADAAPHMDAVYGMAQFFLRYGDQELRTGGGAARSW